MATTVTTSPFTSSGIPASFAAFQMTINPNPSSNTASLKLDNTSNGVFFGAMWTNDPVGNPNPANWNQVSNYPVAGSPNSYPVTPNQSFYIMPMYITSADVGSNNWTKYAPGNCTINGDGSVQCNSALQGSGTANITITVLGGGGGPE